MLVKCESDPALAVAMTNHNFPEGRWLNAGEV